MCAVPNMALFVVPQFRAFLVCYSGTVWVILKWLQSPLLLMVSHLLLFLLLLLLLLLLLIRQLRFKITSTAHG